MLNYIPFCTGKKPFLPLFTVFWGALLTFVIGCGEKLPPDLPKLYPTRVVIIQENKPLEGASVQLLPKDSNSRWAAAGKTDASGRVDFFTEGRYRGVPEGDYQVTVSKTFTEPSQFDKARPDDIDYATWERMAAQEKRDSYHLVDPQYDSRRTSTLELSVGPKQPKDRQIDVGKAFNELIPSSRSS